MRFGLDISQHQLTWDEIVSRARLAEDAGLDGVWVFDHFKALYGDPKGPSLEGWTLLAGLARETSRVRLGTLVTGMTHRHPAVLAAEVVTVDHLSGGRVECAIGAAWNEPEHRELGIPFPPTKERMDRLEEGIQILRALFTEEDFAFEGEHYQLEKATYRPLPIQKPHPPIWVGGEGRKRTLPIAGRYADVWHGWANDSAELAEHRDHRPLGRGSRPRPRIDPSRVEPVDLGAVGRGQVGVRVDDRRRHRLPRDRLAERRSVAPRGVPRASAPDAVMGTLE